MVNVTKENFIEQSNDLLLHLPTAAFVAIDEEMTGISVSKGRVAHDVSPARRYPNLKQAPERYTIIQWGIALYHKVEAETVDKEPDSSCGPQGREDEIKPTATPVDSDKIAENQHTANLSKPTTSFAVRRYNFYMFPGPPLSSRDSMEEEREVVLNPSAVRFLHQHNMSFDLWTRQGVPYVTTERATIALDEYIAKEKELQNGSVASPKDNARRRPVELNRKEDIDFHSRAMRGLRTWWEAIILEPDTSPVRPAIPDVGSAMEAPVADHLSNEAPNMADESASEQSYLLPLCNSYLRRALYDSIEAEFPTLIVETTAANQIQVWRLNDDEKAARAQRLRRESWNDLMGKLGMWRIFEGLRQACSGLDINRSGVLFASSYDEVDWLTVGRDASVNKVQTRPMIPLIVHNGFMDLCFLLTHMHSSMLPESYHECKALISSHFPVVYDTKVLATECHCWESKDGAHNAQSSNVSNLFQTVVSNASPLFGDKPILDEIHVVRPVGYSVDRPPDDQEHEAAFDAYMTGAVFLALCKRIQHFTAGSQSRGFLEVISDGDSMLARQKYGCNKLYQISMYTIDLRETKEDCDPMSHGMRPEFTYRVTGFDKTITTRDIMRYLSEVTDRSGHSVGYEIIWVDDTTFLVAAKLQLSQRSSDASDLDGPTEYKILKEHGGLLLSALRTSFSNQESIEVLVEYEAYGQAGKPRHLIKRSWIEWIFEAIGLSSAK